MTREAVRIIHEEHTAMSAMLQTLHLVARRLKAGSNPQDFDLVRSMLFYMDEFPERLHHAKESSVLFPKVRAKAPEVSEVLDQLDAQHARGTTAIRELEHLLLAFEQLGDTRRAAFIEALDRYVDAYVHHMQQEETAVLPLAQKVLSEEDWTVIELAFREQRDPLTSRKPSDEYHGLLEKILARLPAPYGLGPAN